MGILNEVGANRVGMGLNFFPGCMLNGMPMSLQVITMYVVGLRRQPSAYVIRPPKKLVLSCPIMGIIAKGPVAIGM
jgi:hypothetical protein